MTKLPTVTRAAQVARNERDYDRPMTHVDESGVVFVEVGAVTVEVSEQYGESHVDTQLRLPPATAAELLTRNEAANELRILLERIRMSETTRTAVNHVIDTYGS